MAPSIVFSLCMWSLPVSVDGNPTHCRKCDVESGTFQRMTKSCQEESV